MSKKEPTIREVYEAMVSNTRMAYNPEHEMFAVRQEFMDETRELLMTTEEVANLFVCCLESSETLLRLLSAYLLTEEEEGEINDFTVH